MYKIKQLPEDFVVKELIKLNLDKDGNYTYFWLKKKNWSTLSAIQALSRALNKDFKLFGYAGNKDKQAVTEQLLSAKYLDKSKLEKAKIKDIELKFYGKGKVPLHLGSNSGNEFELVVRNIDSFKKPNNISFINYFDEQRFSTSNTEIGRFLVKRNFRSAADLILQTNTRYNYEIDNHLSKHKNDYVGALKILPKKLLLMYIHAYQAKLFNETVKNYLNTISKKFKTVKTSYGDLLFPLQKAKNLKIQLAGFGIVPDAFLRPVMAAEGLSTRDFIIREFPELSSEGGKRDLLIGIKNIKIGKLEKDELNQAKRKIKLSFDLPKGCYATMVIKTLF